MRLRWTATLTGWLVASVVGAECVRPIDPDALTVSIGWISDDARSLEIFAGGRTRATTRGGREEIRIASWAVAEILRSLNSFGEFGDSRPRDRAGRQHGYFQLAVRCLDVGSGEPRYTAFDVPSGYLEDELRAIDLWLTRLRHLQHMRPIWFHGNPSTEICRPQLRQALGLAVTAPAWCEGRGEGPSFRDGTTREEIREQLRERLERLPPGLQDRPHPPRSGPGTSSSARPSPRR